MGEATLAGIPTGTGKPRWPTVDAFIDACLGYAKARGITLPDQDHDKLRWRQIYEKTYAKEPGGKDPSPDHLAVYLRRLQQRYGRIDTEVLLPLTDQDDHVPVPLAEVFVPPAARLDPPAVELPREVLHHLVEAGELNLDDLPPESLDSKALAHLRQAYRARPAQPVLEVIRNQHDCRMVVLGDPGSGKSTLAQYLALTFAEDAGNGSPAGAATSVPFLIELRGYSDPGRQHQAFLEYLEYLHHSVGLGLPAALVERMLRTGRPVLFIFDGLDEIFDPHLRETIAQRIAGFAAQYPNAGVMVTSRVVGYRRHVLESAGFHQYLLEDLDRGQIATFADRWYRTACRGDAQDAGRFATRLMNAIDASRAVRELARNPLLLTILALIGRRRELPRDRHSVYEHAVTVLVEHWEVSKHLDAVGLSSEVSYFGRADKLDLLRLLARRMQNSESGLSGNYIAEAEMLKTFQNYLEDNHELPPGAARQAARAMRDQLRERNFILSRFGGGVYGFVHRAFLEYLAAADIVESFDNHEMSGNELIYNVFGRHWNDAAWHETLLLIAGMKERFTGEIIELLLSADPFWFLRPGDDPRHVFMAVRCLGEVRRPGALADQGRLIVDAVIDLLELMREREKRGTAVRELARGIAQNIVPTFALMGPHWAGRRIFLDWYQARVLSPGQRTSPEEALQATRIAAALDNHDDFRIRLQTSARFNDDQNMRSAAIQVLAERWATHPDTFGWLRGMVGDPRPDVRRAALQAAAVGWHDRPEAFPLVLDRASTDQHWSVRTTAVEMLGRHWRDRQDTLEVLQARAIADEHFSVRWNALQSLGAVSRADADTTALIRDRAVADPDENIQWIAVQSVASRWRESPDTVRWLTELVSSDPHERIREAAVRALAAGWRSHPGTLSLLHAVIADDFDNKVRRAALESLVTGWRNDADTTPTVEWVALNDPHESTRRAAVIMAATWNSDPDTLAWLRRRATGDPSEIVRQAALEVIVEYWAEQPGVFSFLADRAVEDPGKLVRISAVEALAECWPDNPDTLRVLNDRAEADPDEAVRRAAIRLIPTMDGHPSAFAWLGMLAAGDPRWGVRQTAIQALATGWTNEPESLRLLQACAKDPDEDVRLDAVRLIHAGWSHEDKALRWLYERAVKDPHGQVRRHALRAFARRFDDPGTLALVSDLARNDGDPQVRREALQILAEDWKQDAACLSIAMKQAVDDSDEQVRVTASHLVVLCWEDRTAVTEWLRGRAVDDVHEAVREALLYLVAENWCPRSEGAEWLRERAGSDQHWAVREASIQTLVSGWSQQPGTFAWLREQVRNSPEDVRQAVIGAIVSRWPHEADTLALLRDRAVNDPHWGVRQMASKVLASVDGDFRAPRPWAEPASPSAS